MGSIGTVASKYCINTQSLKEFDRALTFLSSQKKPPKEEESVSAMRTILGVLQPIEQSMSRKLSTTKNLDDYEVVHILHQRHTSNWQDYSCKVQDLIKRFESFDSSITSTDMSILNDIADALDVQCAHLLNRMSGY